MSSDGRASSVADTRDAASSSGATKAERMLNSARHMLHLIRQCLSFIYSVCRCLEFWVRLPLAKKKTCNNMQQHATHRTHKIQPYIHIRTIHFYTYAYTYTHTIRQTDTQRDRQISRQAAIQTDEQTDGPTHKQTSRHTDSDASTRASIDRQTDG